MHYAVGLALALGLFQLMEQWVEVGVVVVRKVDAVGVFLEVAAEEAHAVQHIVGTGHLKALRHLVQHIVDIDFFFGGFTVFGIRREAEVLIANGDALGGEEEPACA